MRLNTDIIRDRFCVVGISYKQADAVQRAKYAIGPEALQQLLLAAKHAELKSVFVISTCNRTEIYAYAGHPHILANLLCRFSSGNMPELLATGYEARGEAAMHHLFRMASGLESQIIGDYEIQGQLKRSITVSRDAGMIGPIMDRTLNFVFQATKKIRTNTGLSSGTISVSYAAIEWLKSKRITKQQKTLVIGAGKFGTSVCKNLVHYLPNHQLHIANRTDATAMQLAEELHCQWVPFAMLDTHLDEFDVIITSTTASEAFVLPHHFISQKQRFIIDLAIPSNVDKSVGKLQGIELADVDDISPIMEQTINRRKSEIPQAELIIEAYKAAFHNWLHTYKHTPGIRRIKEDLYSISRSHAGVCEMAETISYTESEMQEIVQQTVDSLMVTLKADAAKGCHFIDAYRQFLNHPAVAAKAI